MKLLLLACLATAALAIPVSQSELEEWNQFKKTYGKQYNGAEDEKRFKIFSENMNYITKHNELYQKGHKTYNLKMNQFGDLTDDEVRSRNRLRGSKHESVLLFNSALNVSRPEEIDWREKGAVTDVKDQGALCNAGWAFSATGSLEGQLFIKSGKLVPLSAQQVISCSANKDCYGGMMDRAFEYLTNSEGIESEEAYPYEGFGDQCHFKKEGVVATVTGYVDIPSRDEEALQNAIASVGPISIGIDSTHISFRFYNKGIYFQTHCSEFNLSLGALAVGYGSEDDTDYYIVRNSWGKGWGEDGYIRMSRNKDNNCGIATLASYPLVSN